MNVENLCELYLTELRELRSVEDQLVTALPKMAQAARHPQLKQVIEAHLNETRAQRDQLDGLL